jgi:hypothetical protein
MRLLPAELLQPGFAERVAEERRARRKANELAAKVGREWGDDEPRLLPPGLFAS